MPVDGALFRHGVSVLLFSLVGGLFFLHQKGNAHSADAVQVCWRAEKTRSTKQNLKKLSPAFLQLL